MGNLPKTMFKMYAVVPYNISPEQKGVQMTHAALRYAMDERYRKGEKKFKPFEGFFDRYMQECETIVMLSGGTTNGQYSRNDKFVSTSEIGQMQKLYNSLEVTPKSFFIEPDLNDALTAFVFLVPDIVYDREIGSYEMHLRNKGTIASELEESLYVESVKEIMKYMPTDLIPEPTETYVKYYIETANIINKLKLA